MSIINKKCASKLLLFNEFSLEKFRSFLTWKIEFENSSFALLNSAIFTRISFEYVGFWPKIFVPLPWKLDKPYCHNDHDRYRKPLTTLDFADFVSYGAFIAVAAGIIWILNIGVIIINIGIGIVIYFLDATNAKPEKKHVSFHQFPYLF